MPAPTYFLFAGFAIGPIFELTDRANDVFVFVPLEYICAVIVWANNPFALTFRACGVQVGPLRPIAVPLESLPVELAFPTTSALFETSFNAFFIA